MRVERLRASAFRCYARLEIEFGDGVTAVVGPNGAGKTSAARGGALRLPAAGRRARRDEARARRGRRAADRGSRSRRSSRAARRRSPWASARASRSASPSTARRPRSLDALADAVRRSSSSPPTGWRSSRARPPRAARTSTVRWRRAGLPPVRRRRDYARALAAAQPPPAPRSAPEWRTRLRSTPGTTQSRAGGGRSRRPRTRLVERLEPAVRRAPRGARRRRPRRRRSPTGRTARSTRTGCAEALRRRRRRDIERALTGAGPQLDDIVFVEARDVRAFGSQGEQRSALLALRAGRGRHARRGARRAAAAAARRRRLRARPRAPRAAARGPARARPDASSRRPRRTSSRPRSRGRSACAPAGCVEAAMMDGLEALGDVIGGALPATAGRAADVAAIARRWPEAVGEAIAREAWPARLTPRRRAGRACERLGLGVRALPPRT